MSATSHLDMLEGYIRKARELLATCNHPIGTTEDYAACQLTIALQACAAVRRELAVRS